MIKGTLIIESLREEASLTEFRFTVTEVSRGRPKLSPQQIAVGVAPVWCVIEFELEEERAGELADRLAGALDPIGWYANFSSSTETYVVFPGRTFRYTRGDPAGRGQAQDYGRKLGIPEPQLNWTE